jgi:hypothetical protein
LALAVGEPLAQHGDRGGVEGHHPFAVELSERHPQPGPGRPEVHDGIELQLEQHGGWRRRSALAWNFISAITFLIGALTAYGLSERVEVAYLLPFAAGNPIHISAADLLPEIARSCRAQPRYRTTAVTRAAPRPTARIDRERQFHETLVDGRVTQALFATVAWLSS